VSNRHSFRATLSGLLAFLFLLFGSTLAHAVPPLGSLDGPVTDQAGVLGGDMQAIHQAQQDFHAATGGNFYVVIIDSFDGMDREQWAQQTGTNAGLDSRDVLLAISPNDTVTAPTGEVFQGTYWLQYGGDIRFTPEQTNALGAVIDNSLDAALADVATWQNAISNIIGATQNNIVLDETTVTGTEPAPDGVVNDGAAPDPATTPEAGAPVETAPGATVAQEASGGFPGWARVLLITLAAIAALFGLWLLLGRYNEKRLAKRAEANPFNFQ